jgi:hypothetical protein
LALRFSGLAVRCKCVGYWDGMKCIYLEHHP